MNFFNYFKSLKEEGLGIDPCEFLSAL